jgi:type IV secretory pathway VirB4 component
MRSITIGSFDRYGERFPLVLSAADRRQHLYVVGKTGTGKSTLLRSLLAQDLEAGEGCALLDPHGDLALEVLDHVPRWRTDDLVFFDPSDLSFPLAFNPLAPVPPDERHFVARGIVMACRHLWADS